MKLGWNYQTSRKFTKRGKHDHNTPGMASTYHDSLEEGELSALSYMGRARVPAYMFLDKKGRVPTLMNPINNWEDIGWILVTGTPSTYSGFSVTPKSPSDFHGEDNTDFPYWFEEFDFDGDGNIDTLEAVDWINEGRPDVASVVSDIVSKNITPPKASLVSTNTTHTACGPRFEDGREWEDELGLPSNLPRGCRDGGYNDWTRWLTQLKPGTSFEVNWATCDAMYDPTVPAANRDISVNQCKTFIKNDFPENSQSPPSGETPVAHIGGESLHPCFGSKPIGYNMLSFYTDFENDHVYGSEEVREYDGNNPILDSPYSVDYGYFPVDCSSCFHNTFFDKSDYNIYTLEHSECKGDPITGIGIKYDNPGFSGTPNHCLCTCVNENGQRETRINYALCEGGGGNCCAGVCEDTSCPFDIFAANGNNRTMLSDDTYGEYSGLIQNGSETPGTKKCRGDGKWNKVWSGHGKSSHPFSQFKGPFIRLDENGEDPDGNANFYQNGHNLYDIGPGNTAEITDGGLEGFHAHFSTANEFLRTASGPYYERTPSLSFNYYGGQTGPVPQTDQNTMMATTYFIPEHHGMYRFCYTNDDYFNISFDGGMNWEAEEDDYHSYNPIDQGGDDFNLELSRGVHYPVMAIYAESGGNANLNVKYVTKAEHPTDWNTMSIPDCLAVGHEITGGYYNDLDVLKHSSYYNEKEGGCTDTPVLEVHDTPIPEDMEEVITGMTGYGSAPERWGLLYEDWEGHDFQSFRQYCKLNGYDDWDEEYSNLIFSYMDPHISVGDMDMNAITYCGEAEPGEEGNYCGSWNQVGWYAYFMSIDAYNVVTQLGCIGEGDDIGTCKFGENKSGFTIGNEYQSHVEIYVPKIGGSHTKLNEDGIDKWYEQNFGSGNLSWTPTSTSWSIPEHSLDVDTFGFIKIPVTWNGKDFQQGNPPVFNCKGFEHPDFHLYGYWLPLPIELDFSYNACPYDPDDWGSGVQSCTAHCHCSPGWMCQGHSNYGDANSDSYIDQNNGMSGCKPCGKLSPGKYNDDSDGWLGDGNGDTYYCGQSSGLLNTTAFNSTWDLSCFGSEDTSDMSLYSDLDNLYTPCPDGTAQDRCGCEAYPFVDYSWAIGSDPWNHSFKGSSVGSFPGNYNITTQVDSHWNPATLLGNKHLIGYPLRTIYDEQDLPEITSGCIHNPLSPNFNCTKYEEPDSVYGWSHCGGLGSATDPYGFDYINDLDINVDDGSCHIRSDGTFSRYEPVLVCEDGITWSTPYDPINHFQLSTFLGDEHGVSVNTDGPNHSNHDQSRCYNIENPGLRIQSQIFSAVPDLSTFTFHPWFSYEKSPKNVRGPGQYSLIGGGNEKEWDGGFRRSWSVSRVEHPNHWDPVTHSEWNNVFVNLGYTDFTSHILSNSTDTYSYRMSEGWETPGQLAASGHHPAMSENSVGALIPGELGDIWGHVPRRWEDAAAYFTQHHEYYPFFDSSVNTLGTWNPDPFADAYWNWGQALNIYKHTHSADEILGPIPSPSNLFKDGMGYQYQPGGEHEGYWENVMGGTSGGGVPSDMEGHLNIASQWYWIPHATSHSDDQFPFSGTYTRQYTSWGQHPHDFSLYLSNWWDSIELFHDKHIEGGLKRSKQGGILAIHPTPGYMTENEIDLRDDLIGLEPGDEIMIINGFTSTTPTDQNISYGHYTIKSRPFPCNDFNPQVEEKCCDSYGNNYGNCGHTFRTHAWQDQQPWNGAGFSNTGNESAGPIECYPQFGNPRDFWKESTAYCIELDTLIDSKGSPPLGAHYIDSKNKYGVVDVETTHQYTNTQRLLQSHLWPIHERVVPYGCGDVPRIDGFCTGGGIWSWCNQYSNTNQSTCESNTDYNGLNCRWETQKWYSNFEHYYHPSDPLYDDSDAYHEWYRNANEFDSPNYRYQRDNEWIGDKGFQICPSYNFSYHTNSETGNEYFDENFMDVAEGTVYGIGNWLSTEHEYDGLDNVTPISWWNGSHELIDGSSHTNQQGQPYGNGWIQSFGKAVPIISYIGYRKKSSVPTHNIWDLRENDGSITVENASLYHSMYDQDTFFTEDGTSLPSNMYYDESLSKDPLIPLPYEYENYQRSRYTLINEYRPEDGWDKEDTEFPYIAAMNTKYYGFTKEWGKQQEYFNNQYDSYITHFDALDFDGDFTPPHSEFETFTDVRDESGIYCQEGTGPDGFASLLSPDWCFESASGTCDYGSTDEEVCRLVCQYEGLPYLSSKCGHNNNYLTHCSCGVSINDPATHGTLTRHSKKLIWNGYEDETLNMIVNVNSRFSDVEFCVDSSCPAEIENTYGSANGTVTIEPLGYCGDNPGEIATFAGWGKTECLANYQTWHDVSYVKYTDLIQELLDNYNVELDRKSKVNVCFYGGVAEFGGHATFDECYGDSSCDQCVKNEFCPSQFSADAYTDWASGNAGTYNPYNTELVLDGQSGLACLQETEREHLDKFEWLTTELGAWYWWSLPPYVTSQAFRHQYDHSGEMNHNDGPYYSYQLPDYKTSWDSEADVGPDYYARNKRLRKPWGNLAQSVPSLQTEFKENRKSIANEFCKMYFGENFRYVEHTIECDDTDYEALDVQSAVRFSDERRGLTPNYFRIRGVNPLTNTGGLFATDSDSTSHEWDWTFNGSSPFNQHSCFIFDRFPTTSITLGSFSGPGYEYETHPSMDQDYYPMSPFNDYEYINYIDGKLYGKHGWITRLTCENVEGNSLLLPNRSNHFYQEKNISQWNYTGCIPNGSKSGLIGDDSEYHGGTGYSVYSPHDCISHDACTEYFDNKYGMLGDVDGLGETPWPIGAQPYPSGYGNGKINQEMIVKSRGQLCKRLGQYGMTDVNYSKFNFDGDIQYSSQPTSPISFRDMNEFGDYKFCWGDFIDDTSTSEYGLTCGKGVFIEDHPKYKSALVKYTPNPDFNGTDFVRWGAYSPTALNALENQGITTIDVATVGQMNDSYKNPNIPTYNGFDLNIEIHPTPEQPTLDLTETSLGSGYWSTLVGEPFYESEYYSDFGDSNNKYFYLPQTIEGSRNIFIALSEDAVVEWNFDAIIPGEVVTNNNVIVKGFNSDFIDNAFIKNIGSAGIHGTVSMNLKRWPGNWGDYVEPPQEVNWEDDTLVPPLYNYCLSYCTEEEPKSGCIECDESINPANGMDTYISSAPWVTIEVISSLNQRATFTLIFWMEEAFEDCTGDPGGTAQIDDCGVCSGGTGSVSHLTPSFWTNENNYGGDVDCAQVCSNGYLIGEVPEVISADGPYETGAYNNECGVCVGGNSGNPEYIQYVNVRVPDGQFSAGYDATGQGNTSPGNITLPYGQSCHGGGVGSSYGCCGTYIDNCGIDPITLYELTGNFTDYGQTFIDNNCSLCISAYTDSVVNQFPSEGIGEYGLSTSNKDTFNLDYYGLDCTGTCWGSNMTDDCGQCVGKDSEAVSCYCQLMESNVNSSVCDFWRFDYFDDGSDKCNCNHNAWEFDYGHDDFADNSVCLIDHCEQCNGETFCNSNSYFDGGMTFNDEDHGGGQPGSSSDHDVFDTYGVRLLYCNSPSGDYTGILDDCGVCMNSDGYEDAQGYQNGSQDWLWRQRGVCDCNGDQLGGAWWNRCGYCVEGLTCCNPAPDHDGTCGDWSYDTCTGGYDSITGECLEWTTMTVDCSIHPNCMCDKDYGDNGCGCAGVPGNPHMGPEPTVCCLDSNLNGLCDYPLSSSVQYFCNIGENQPYESCYDLPAPIGTQYIPAEGAALEGEILGCSDPEALNYNPDTTWPDGSCVYINYTKTIVTSKPYPEAYGQYNFAGGENYGILTSEDNKFYSSELYTIISDETDIPHAIVPGEGSGITFKLKFRKWHDDPNGSDWYVKNEKVRLMFWEDGGPLPSRPENIGNAADVQDACNQVFGNIECGFAGDHSVHNDGDGNLVWPYDIVKRPIFVEDFTEGVDVQSQHDWSIGHQSYHRPRTHAFNHETTVLTQADLASEPTEHHFQDSGKEAITLSLWRKIAALRQMGKKGSKEVYYNNSGGHWDAYDPQAQGLGDGGDGSAGDSACSLIQCPNYLSDAYGLGFLSNWPKKTTYTAFGQADDGFISSELPDLSLGYNGSLTTDYEYDTGGTGVPDDFRQDSDANFYFLVEAYGTRQNCYLGTNPYSTTLLGTIDISQCGDALVNEYHPIGYTLYTIPKRWLYPLFFKGAVEDPDGNIDGVIEEGDRKYLDVCFGDCGDSWDDFWRNQCEGSGCSFQNPIQFFHYDDFYSHAQDPYSENPFVLDPSPNAIFAWEPLFYPNEFWVRFYAPDLSVAEEDVEEDVASNEGTGLPELSQQPMSVSVMNRNSFLALNPYKTLARSIIDPAADFTFDYRPITDVKAENYYDLQTFWEKYEDFATPGIGAPSEVTLSTKLALNDNEMIPNIWPAESGPNGPSVGVFGYVLTWDYKEGDPYDNFEDIFINLPTSTAEIFSLQEKDDRFIVKDLVKGEDFVHTYITPGIKTIKLMTFSYAYNTDGYTIQAIRWKLLTIKLNLQTDRAFVEDFNIIGGPNFRFLPWPVTSPIIGGLSEDSEYIQTLTDVVNKNLWKPAENEDKKNAIKSFDNFHDGEFGDFYGQFDLSQVRYFKSTGTCRDSENNDNFLIYNTKMTCENNGGTWEDRGGRRMSDLLMIPNIIPRYVNLGGEVFPGGCYNCSMHDGNEIDCSDHPECIYDTGSCVCAVGGTSDNTCCPDPTFVPDEESGTIVYEYHPYSDVNYWDGLQWTTKIPDETCVGTLFINDNMDPELRDDCTIELNFDKNNLVNDEVKDSSGNQNYGILIGDYALTKDSEETPIIRDSSMDLPEFDSSDKAF